jgi:RNA polymerase sigma-70 factor (ECF subfamily)
MSMPEAAAAASDFDALFTHFYGRLARLLYRITGDAGRAEEIASEAFWRLYQKPPATNVNVEGWLYRTGTRLALDELKKQQRRSRYEALASLFGIAPNPNPHQLLEQSEDAARVRRALSAVKTDQAAIILLRSEGFTYAEIAIALGINPASVGALLARAEEAFRKAYE